MTEMRRKRAPIRGRRDFLELRIAKPVPLASAGCDVLPTDNGRQTRVLVLRNVVFLEKQANPTISRQP